MYRHIVLFKIYPETKEEQIDTAKQLLWELGNQEYIKEWIVTESVDTRKGVVIIQNGLFLSREDFEEYRKTDLHRRVGEHMSKVADWVVGDYLE